MSKPVVSHPKADKRAQLTLTLKPSPKKNKQTILKLDAHMNNELTFEQMTLLSDMGVVEPFVRAEITNLHDVKIDSDVGQVTILYIDAESEVVKVDTLSFDERAHHNEPQYIDMADMSGYLPASVDTPLIIVTHPHADSPNSDVGSIQTYLLGHCPNGFVTSRSSGGKLANR